MIGRDIPHLLIFLLNHKQKVSEVTVREEKERKGERSNRRGKRMWRKGRRRNAEGGRRVGKRRREGRERE